MSTEFPSKNGIDRQWHVIDAQDVVLGKLATQGGYAADGQDTNRSTRRFSIPAIT